MVEHIDRGSDDHDPSVHHEESDVNVGAILKFIVGFVILAALIHVGLWFLFDIFRRQERKKDVAAVSEVPGSRQRQYPPAPRLQPFPEPADLATPDQKNKRWRGLGNELSNAPINDPTRSTPEADMVEMDRQQREELHNYGWADRRSGVVRIPIDQAKRLLVTRGLPVRREPAAAPGQGQTAVPVAGQGQQSGVPVQQIGTQQVSPTPAPPRSVEPQRTQ